MLGKLVYAPAVWAFGACALFPLPYKHNYMAIPKNLFLVFCLADLYGCCVADPRGYNAVLLL